MANVKREDLKASIALLAKVIAVPGITSSLTVQLRTIGTDLLMFDMAGVLLAVAWCKCEGEGFNGSVKLAFDRGALQSAINAMSTDDVSIDVLRTGQLRLRGGATCTLTPVDGGERQVVSRKQVPKDGIALGQELIGALRLLAGNVGSELKLSGLCMRSGGVQSCDGVSLLDYQRKGCPWGVGSLPGALANVLAADMRLTMDKQGTWAVAPNGVLLQPRNEDLRQYPEAVLDEYLKQTLGGRQCAVVPMATLVEALRRCRSFSFGRALVIHLNRDSKSELTLRVDEADVQVSIPLGVKAKGDCQQRWSAERLYGFAQFAFSQAKDCEAVFYSSSGGMDGVQAQVAKAWSLTYVTAHLGS